MIATNKLLQRWVLASISQHLHNAASEIGLPFVVEGLDSRSDTFKAAPAKAEAMIVGPHTRELSPLERRTEVSVFVIVTTDGQADENAWNHSDRCGQFQNALDKCILVKKHADGVVDPELVGELHPRTDRDTVVDVTHIKAGENDQLVHSTIEGFYVGFLP